MAPDGIDPALLEKEDGGARRDRTDDLKLAKLALSQLSYGPVALPARQKSEIRIQKPEECVASPQFPSGFRVSGF